MDAPSSLDAFWLRPHIAPSAYCAQASRNVEIGIVDEDWTCFDEKQDSDGSGRIKQEELLLRHVRKLRLPAPRTRVVILSQGTQNSDTTFQSEWPLDHGSNAGERLEQHS